jgi:hypothetical protein
MALIKSIKAIILLFCAENSLLTYLDMCTINTDISDGDTPDILEA